ncbi:MAG: hypothetical protein WD181_04520 [Solirubrobacterales bacterium]
MAAAFVALAMLLSALSLWTVVPLVWLWIGSQLAGTQFPSLWPYAVVLFGVILSIIVVAWLIGLMNDLYLRLTGSHTVEPIRLGWMKSLRDSARQQPPTLLEVVVVGSVIISAITLVIWFFTLAGSPLEG